MAYLRCKNGCNRIIGNEEPNDENMSVFHVVRFNFSEKVETECKQCGLIDHRDPSEIPDAYHPTGKSTKAGLTKYPYIEPQSGVLVKSAEHRVEVWKKLGFRPVGEKRLK